MKEVGFDVCKTTVIHREKVDCVKHELQDRDFTDLIVLSKCLSDASRVQILYALATFKEMCVCDLAAIIDASMATTSHHLKFLKKHGVAKSSKEGKMVYYSLANQHITRTVAALLKATEN